MIHIRAAFISALSQEGITKQTFAKQRDLCPTLVSKFLYGAKSLTPSIKRCICLGWETEGLGIEILRAHLQDELEAAGLADKYTITLFPIGKAKDSQQNSLSNLDLKNMAEDYCGKPFLNHAGVPMGKIISTRIADRHIIVKVKPF